MLDQRAGGQNCPVPSRDVDAIVIGAGHNGLVCAAYLARAGLSTLLLEARAAVGGTAASEPFGGGIVNVCSCDHLTFRTTPVIEELALADHGLRYLDVEPAQLNLSWTDPATAWPSYHDVDRTLEALRALHPGEVAGYERYLRDALPAVRLILAAAAEPPSWGGMARLLARRRGRGAATLTRWSRSSAADIVRRYFATEALRGPALVTGPMVWGISPETPGSGLGALTYALRHVARLGRPEGGSGMVPTALARAFAHHGGTLRTGCRVEAILCDQQGVAAVRTAGGDEITADLVVSACDPRRTFVGWLKNPPAGAGGLVRRWAGKPVEDGYESKIDAIVSRLPDVAALPSALVARLGGDPGASTLAIAPSLADMHRGAQLIASGQVLEHPGFIANVPSALDPSMAPPGGGHVFSLEALFTPYALAGGWRRSAEPWRWLEVFARLAGGDAFLETIGPWRAVTPIDYEQEFNLPAGHATSFAGGPLAALRNRDPELTRYATAVRGLYLTGAATFPGAGIWGASGRNAALVALSAR